MSNICAIYFRIEVIISSVTVGWAVCRGLTNTKMEKTLRLKLNIFNKGFAQFCCSSNKFFADMILLKKLFFSSSNFYFPVVEVIYQT